MRALNIVASVAIVVGFGLSFFLSAAAFAADQKASAFVLCKNQKNVRTIKILPDKSIELEPKTAGAKPLNGCAVSYSKSGVDEVVGTNKSLDTCKSILKSIQFNLETSKWSCRTVQTAVVTTSKETVTE